MKEQNRTTAQTMLEKDVPVCYYEANNETNEKEHISFVKKHKKALASVGAAVILGAGAFTAFAANYAVGYTVKVDNKVVGTVATKGAYYEVLNEVKTEIKDSADVEFVPGGAESFQMEIISKASLTDKDELAENLKSTTEGMVEGAQIVADGTVFATFSTEEEANSVLNRYLALYRTENVTAEFVGDVSVVTTLVLEEAVQTEEDVYQVLLAGKAVTYTPEKDETAAQIAEKFGVTEEAVLADNGIAENEDMFGKPMTIYTGEPIFSVKTVEHLQGETEIPFETQTKEDARFYEGSTRTEIAGQNGVRFTDRYITKIDGEMVEETVLEDTVIKEPVTEVKLVGTKERPQSVGTGEFVMPTSGKITSPFGPRWGRTHSGIDVGAKTGTPIYASDNGIVTLSEYKNNGYGNLITIDHGNGFVTFYAHCSELLVNEGDVVAKGDLIAKVGNTGRSTGPHLHFEIREDGTAKNPMNYID